MVKSDRLAQFTDTFVDSAIYEASTDEDPTIKTLAKTILSRTPPKSLKQVLVLEEVNQEHHKGSTFIDRCRSNLKALADRYSVNLGLFLLYTDTLSLEKHGGRFTGREYAELPPDERKDQLKKEMEIIQIYRPDNLEKPVSLLDIDYSIIGKLRDQILRIYRLYFVAEKGNETLIDELKREVASWTDVADSI